MCGRVRVNTLPGLNDVLPIYFVDKYGCVYGTNGMELKQHDNGKGYLTVSLKVKDKRRFKKAYVHRLVGFAFVENKNPDAYNEIDHIDSNKKNNHYKNLKWVDRSENMQNPITKAKMQGINGTKCYVYDFLLNYIGEFDSLLAASQEIKHDIKALNSRVAEYYILQDRDLNRILTINRKQKLQSVVITDIFTNEKLYFYSNREARRYFHGRVNITQAIQKNWTVKGRYKVRALNYKKLIGMLDL